MARDFARAFYKSNEWKAVREAVLMRDKYLCVKCGKPAEEVHHIIHLSVSNINHPNVTLNQDNLMSLCRSCHFNEHRGQHGAGREHLESVGMNDYYFDENGVVQQRVSPRSK